MKKNKKTVLWALILLVCAQSAGAATSNFSSRSQRSPNKKIQIADPSGSLMVGEKLIYDVSWMGVPVGIGEVEITEKRMEKGEEVYRVRALAKTNEVLSKLYPVEDHVESLFSTTDFRSLYFRKKLSEGRYRADEETEFDSARRKGIYRSKLNGGQKEFDTAKGVLDIVSAFYAFRTKPVKTGDKVHFTVSSEEKDWDVEVDVLETQTKEMKGRVIETFLAEPKTRLRGILYSRGRVWIHYTADERRIPVLIQLKTPFGPIVGVLRDFDTV